MINIQVKFYNNIESIEKIANKLTIWFVYQKAKEHQLTAGISN